MSQIRNINKNDLTYLKTIVESNELFPSELLEDMTADFLANKDSTDIWLTMAVDNMPVAVAYCALERMTSGTYNLYLIAVHKDFHGKGIGTQMMIYIEELLRKEGNRILIVETSGLPDFELTRKFYHKLNYQREAVIREFYDVGDDKVVFWKKLNAKEMV